MKEKSQSFIRYLFVTGLSFVTNFGLTVLLTEVVNLPEELSFAVALMVVFFLNFFLMRHYIYTGCEGSTKRQFIMYAFSAIGFRGTEYVAFLMIHTWLGVQYAVAIIGIQVWSSIVKFFYYGGLVFTKKRSTL